MNPVTTNPYRLEKQNVAILVISQVAFMVAAITVMTLSGVVGQQLSPDPGLATLPIAIMMLGTVFSTLPASLFMKNVGRRRGFMVGALLGVGGGLVSFGGIVAESFALFCFGSMLLGVYQGFAMYYRFAALDVASPSFRSRAISFVLAGGVVAAFLGPWNASALGDVVSSVPNGAPYLSIAVLALLVFVLLTQLKVPYVGEAHQGEVARPLRAIGRNPAFVVALASGALGYAIMVLVMTATPLAMRAQAFSMDQVAFIMQWHVLGMYVPSFFTGALISRVGLSRVLMAGCTILIVAVVTAMQGASLAHFWVALVCLGVGWNFLFIGGSTLLSSLHTEAERGKVQGVNDLIIFVLVTIGSLMSGTLLHQLGWETLNVLMLAPIAVVALSVLWMGARKRSAPVSDAGSL
ncbi:MFS transporter [Marinobacter daepoensis]|uniref:MFS transporter n=1 Tax=Marinobacter daepoensis TaxID=262077 RepID=UPI0004278E39|nr:MFS transporter [Marinobacter daepoensis]MBY6032326.1 MFS transporter [Marinobacter daepoensis]